MWTAEIPNHNPKRNEEKFLDAHSSSESIAVFPSRAVTQLNQYKENVNVAVAHMSTPTTTRPKPPTTDTTTPTTTPKHQHNDPYLMRLQRDLNSPNAALRVRAMQALKSPSKAAAYHTFDVPLAEQSIITADERNPKPLPTLRDILANVVVYVEVRTGNDNRSEGVKTIIAKMGAQVNDRLLRNTTHVVFKDGLLSTYKKAGEWNIPIVSILWIEACKVQRRLCEPEQFPISNLHKYEYPELFGKITRVRCMQPDSELNKRQRKRQDTPTSKDKEAVGTPKSTPKNDITRFLKILKNNKHLGSASQDDEAIESPATKLLNRMSNGSFTPCHGQPGDGKSKTNGCGDAIAIIGQDKLTSQKSLTFTEESARGDEVVEVPASTKRPRRSTVEPAPVSTPTPKAANRRRSCSIAGELQQTQVAISAAASEPRMTRRRSSLQLAANDSPMELTKKPGFFSIHEETEETPTRSTRRRRSSTASATKQSSYQTNMEEPQPMVTRRRSSLHLPASAPMEAITSNESVSSVGRRRSSSWHQATSSSKDAFKKTLFYPIAEEVHTEITMEMSNVATPVATQERRQTVYTPQQMDISRTNISTRSITTSSTDLSENNDQMELTMLQQRSLVNVTTQTSQYSDEEPLFSSTRLPVSRVSSSSNTTNNRRRTIFSLDMHVINEGIDRINRSCQRRSLALANEAELGECHKIQSPIAIVEQEVEKPPQAVQDPATPSEPKRRRLFTPNEEVIISPPKSNRKSRLSICNGQPGSAAKRRRTLAAPSTNSSSETKETTTKPSVTETPKPQQPTVEKEVIPEATKETAPSNTSLAEVAKTNHVEVFSTPKGSSLDINTDSNLTDSTNIQTTPSANTDGKTSTAKRRQRVIRTLVHTNMHQEQIHVIHKALRKLHGMRLDPTVTKRTTHLVSLDPRRTLNLLRGLMRGVWIVSYNWILESLRSGKWVYEEPYELKVFSRAVEICRTERQAFGKDYRCELFRFMESFYVSSHCQPLQFNNVKELLMLGGAKITENRFKAKYIIGDKRRVEDDRLYLSVNWVLDSITAMQIQKFGKYLMKSAIVTPAGIRYDNPPAMDNSPPSSNRKLHMCHRDPALVLNK
ncbi:microcephalin isoform X2 [Drosophila tropicalis]|uniref:microcephalin isoform X2 n=1 Tax=Drosophila tropicalis TaxID=46794 RepID=UPI0035ABA981